MKDKRAAKIKKRRRAERRADIEKAKQMFFEDFEQAAKKNGTDIKKYDKEFAWRINKRLQKELTEKSIMCCVISTMYCLNRDCGWGCNRLFNYCSWCKAIIDHIAAEDRTIVQLAEELRYDAELDIPDMFDGYKPFGGVPQTGERNAEAAVLLAGIKNSMVIALYQLYNRAGWRRKRMNRIAEAVKETAIDALENGHMDELVQEIERKTGVRVSYSGRTETRINRSRSVKLNI